MHYPPNNHKELIRLLKRLGFVQVHSGKHSYKFKHPTKRTINATQRPFITISTGKGATFSKIVIKELIKTFGFTESEIKKAC